MKRCIVGGAMSVTVALGIIANAVAAPADANPSQDAQFLTLITRAGMGYTSADSAIWQGHKICTLLDEGYSVLAVERAAEAAFYTDEDHALAVMAAAVVVYCPWNDPGPSRSSNI
jgi:Protein of unknown function (DUF732)